MFQLTQQTESDDQHWILWLTQEAIDSNNLSHNPTKVISLDDDDNVVEDVFDCKSSFDPDFHPVSDPGHVPTTELSNDLKSVPCPNPIPQASPDPGPDTIGNIINGTFNSSIFIEDHDGYLAMERILDGELYYNTFPMFQELNTSLDIMHDTDDFWNNIKGAPSVHGPYPAHIDTQRQCHFELLEKQKTSEKNKWHQDFLDYVHDQLGKDTTFGDPTNNDEDDAPNYFVYFKDDREETSSEPLWKEFEIPLLDENRKPCLDDDGEPITIIEKDPKSLHSTIFLTTPDKHGEQTHTQVVELIDVFHTHLKDHKQ